MLELTLHPVSPVVEGIRVFAEAERNKNLLKLQFEIEDADLQILNGFVSGKYSDQQLQRQNDLWQTTCLEAFFSYADTLRYFEINLSPCAPFYNVYEFSDYRVRHPSETTAVDLRSLNVNQNSLCCDLVLAKEEPIYLSLCAVIKTVAGQFFYSTKHVDSKPDFHRRESFTLRI